MIGKKLTYKELEEKVKELEKEAVERRRADEALRESEEKLAGIIASVTDHMSMMDEQHNIVWANDVARELFGPDLVGKKCYSAYHGYDKPCEPCVVTKSFEDGKVHKHETEVIRADGKRMIFWCKASVAAWDSDGRPKMVVEVSRNITDRKRAKKALQKARDELEIRVRGRTAELLESNEKLRLEIAERKRAEEELRDTIKRTEIAYEQSIIYARQLNEEIGERKRAEEALRESEVRYRTLVEQLPAITYTAALDETSTTLYVSPQIERMLGFSPKEYEKDPNIWDKQLHPEDRERVLKEVALSHESGSPFVSEYRMLTKDGHTIWFRDEAIMVRDETGNPLFLQGLMHNITDRKRAEEEKKKLEAQLQHAQKMEAIGTLADGIAHDFNNILQAISGYVQLLSMKNEGKESESRYLNQIDKSTRRAAELTRQLLVFGRKVESKLRPMDLNREVIQAHTLLQRTIPKMIDIELHLAQDLKTINADPIQLEQIMMNLGINAKDAMPDGGKLVFETKNVILDETYCKAHLEVVSGEYVLVSISDTGHGMDKEILEHIFEPFYTTKELGKGTGLGLAMVYGIVKSHGGHIMCYSEPGQGTAFKIYFPVLEANDVDQEVEPKKEAEICGGHETILLVDDEETLLDLEQDMLRQYGYTAITAKSGEWAVEIYKTEKDRIDLVILDVGMPGMGGHKCLQELLKIDPEVKVIIASGYPSIGKVKETLESGAAGFIGKPYNLKDMLKKVREFLDQ